MTDHALLPTEPRKQRIQNLITEMNTGLLERQEQVKLLLLAALSGEHVLLLGQPGTAKSELAKRLRNAFVEANYFERLLTRFSVPEELFGPLSIKALEEDSYKRLTSGYLPEASVAFIDEIFKANSAILNSLLTLLNERQFDNGNRRYCVPLISVIAASNELPEGEELDALYDRFMLRSFVHPISDSAFEQLLNLEVNKFDPDLATRLKVEELSEVQRMAEKITLSNSVIELCKAFRKHLDTESIYVSDRRWRKVIKLMKVSAFTSGFDEVTPYDAWLLPHCLWKVPEQFEELQKLYKQAIAINGDFTPTRVAKTVTAWEARLNQEASANTQKSDDKGRPLFTSPKGNETIKSSSEQQKKNHEGQLLYSDRHGRETTENSDYHRHYEPVMVDTPHPPVLVPSKYSASHISDRLGQVRGIKLSVEEHMRNLSAQLAGLETLFKDHLWIDASLLPEISNSIQKAHQHTTELLDRICAVEAGYEKLPQEEDFLISDAVMEDYVLEGELCG